VIARDDRFLTPPEVARRLRVNRDKVLGWIRDGELVASDVSSRPGSGRPRWRIDPRNLELFLQRRQCGGAPKSPRRRKRDPNVKEFF